jgi:hypothetical protein
MLLSHEFRHRVNLILPSLIMAALAILAAGCGSSLQIASRWSDQKMKVDGSLKEWSDSTVFVEKDGLRCGVMNDDEFVYVCVMSSRPNIGRQILFRGMTVWFDPNGGSKKTIGIRFPIGMRRGEMPVQPEGEETDQRGNRIDAMERQAVSDFEFVGPTEKDLQMVSRLQGQGVEMHLTSTPERFVYELKVPLAYSSVHPYAIESHAGSPIGVGFETNAVQRAAAAEGGGEGGRGGRGGMPGAGGGRGGGRMPGAGGQGGNRQGAATMSFDIWAHVQLAAQKQ